MEYVHLPHLDFVGHYQFITFRTFDSTDKFLKKLSLQNKPNNKIQLDVDSYLDDSHNGAYLNGEILITLSSFLKNKDQILYNLIAFFIMPNHVHLLIKPLKKLSSVMHIVKGSSAKLINESMEKNGKFWANEYYDKAIRNEKHFGIVYDYIKNNPLKLSEALASPIKNGNNYPTVPIKF